MLSPPLSGTPDATETVGYTAYDRIERGRAEEEDFPVGRRSKARVRCTWKDCNHQAHDADEMKWVTLLARSVTILLNFVSGNMPPLTDAVLKRAAVGLTLGIRSRRIVTFGSPTNHGPKPPGIPQ